MGVDKEQRAWQADTKGGGSNEGRETGWNGFPRPWRRLAHGKQRERWREPGIPEGRTLAETG